MATTETKSSDSKTASGLVVVICGVSGSGKSTIAADLAKALNGAEFADADSFHSKENKEKMASGTPLTDEDRQPWLEALHAWASKLKAQQKIAVLACSALKRKYRSIIRGSEQPRPDVVFVLLSGSKELIASRMAERKHEFMSSKLLDSQFQTLELPDAKEGVLTVSIEPSPAEIVANIVKLLQQQGLQTQTTTKASAGGAPSLRDRFVGSLLGGVIGDALGAAFEGYPWQMILQAKPDLTVYSAAPHMGIRELGPRKGMYTDDSNSTLALLDSLVEHRHLHPVRVARNYGCFWRSDPQRGYPDSAQEVMRQVLNGASIKDTGRAVFAEGSFANGGAMRIAPVGLAFRDADADTMQQAVELAIISSHVHPEGVDAAYVQAAAIAWLLKRRAPDSAKAAHATSDSAAASASAAGAGGKAAAAAAGDSKASAESKADSKAAASASAELPVATGQAYLEYAISVARTPKMRKSLEYVLKRFKGMPESSDPSINIDAAVLSQVADDFQIVATEAIATVCWFVAKFMHDPFLAVQKSILVGGDTDTIAAMVANQLGALHGCDWLPKNLIEGLENGPRGRDFCVSLAERLAAMDSYGAKQIVKEYKLAMDDKTKAAATYEFPKPAKKARGGGGGAGSAASP